MDSKQSGVAQAAQLIFSTRQILLHVVQPPCLVHSQSSLVGKRGQDEQLAAIVAYVCNQFGDKKTAVETGEAGKWRKQFASQRRPYSRKDLENLLKLS